MGKLQTQYEDPIAHFEEIVQEMNEKQKADKLPATFSCNFSVRPVFVSREEHIEAHFLICFLALVLMCVLEHKIGNKYSTHKIIESLNKVSGTHLKENYYLFDYFDNVVEDIGDAIDIDFTARILKLGDIKKF